MQYLSSRAFPYCETVKYTHTVRRLWDSPCRIHGFLLPGIRQGNPVEFQLHSRSFNFIRTFVSSDNSLVSACMSGTKEGVR